MEVEILFAKHEQKDWNGQPDGAPFAFLETRLPSAGTPKKTLVP
jgi:hypothetical protein